MSGRVIMATVALLAIASASGCGGKGGPTKAEIAQERTKLTKVLAAEVTRRERQQAVKSAETREMTCRLRIETPLDSVRALTESTSIFITISSYNQRLAELDTELNRVPRGSLDSACLKVLKFVEDAADDHHKAYDAAFSCAVTYSNVCDIATDKDYRLILNDYWGFAASDARRAEKALRAMAKDVHPKRHSPFLPRTEASVRTSLVGGVADLLCATSTRPTAVEPCQSLRDVLAQGVTVEEEAELNDALAGIAHAYGLGVAPKPSGNGST
jgi:hypothetical protein